MNFSTCQSYKLQKQCGSITIETKQTTSIRKNTLHNNCKKNEETKLVFCSSLLDIEEGFDNSLPSGYFSFSSYFVPQPVKLKF